MDFLLVQLLYLDPGSGSLIIQLVLGALLGAGLAVRVFWKKIKQVFSGKSTPAAETDDPTDDSSE